MCDQDSLLIIYLGTQIPKNVSIQFEVGVNSYIEEPSDQDVVDGEFSRIEDFTLAAKDEENIYTYILTSFTDKNKPFVTISIKNLEEVEHFDVLVKNGDIPQGVKVYNLPFNQEVTLKDEVETPLYFNVSVPEQIKDKNISFIIKVPKNKLSDSKLSVSGYSSAPDIQNFSKNLIEKKEDQESEVTGDGEYEVNKYSVDNIEGATYLLLKFETSFTVELSYALVKVFSEDEGKKESPKEPEKESKGLPTVFIVILCIVSVLIIFLIIFLVAKKFCCNSKEVTSETIEKDFSPNESKELH
jgi:hypothetical protein